MYQHTKFTHDHLRGFFSPYARNGASKCLGLLDFFFRFFQRPTAEASEAIFMHNTSNDVLPRKDVHFRD